MICSLNAIIGTRTKLLNFIKFVDPKLYESYLLEDIKNQQRRH